MKISFSTPAALPGTWKQSWTSPKERNSMVWNFVSSKTTINSGSGPSSQVTSSGRL